MHDLDFDINYLKLVWDRQKGICPISGLSLILPTYKNRRVQSINTGSIDRIDNKKGYVKRNIRFISILANYALNRYFTDEELKEFCYKVYKNGLRKT